MSARPQTARPSASAVARAPVCTPVDTTGNVPAYLNKRMEDIANGKCNVETLFSDFFTEAGSSAFFKKKFKEDYDYNYDNRTSFKEFMNEIKELKGFVRVITQNMHCRDRSIVGARSLLGSANPTTPSVSGWMDTAIYCEAYAPGFYDDQRARTTAFVESIKSGEIHRLQPDVIAIQEMQEYEEATVPGIKSHSRNIIENALKRDKNWGLVLPKGNATYSRAAIPSGLGFVFNRQKVRHISSNLYQFPTDFSSGADAGAVTSTMSFKGVLIGEFEVISTRDAAGTVGSGKRLVIFNIHPSPYVDLPDYVGTTSPRSVIVDQIVKTHMYQCLFIALKMKELYQGRTQKPTILLCGDWNINKFLSNGTTGFGNALAPREYKDIIEASPQTAGMRPSSSGPSNVQVNHSTTGPSAVPKPNATGVNIGPLIEPSAVPVVLPPTSKKCFKEDMPYIGEGVGKRGTPAYCDEACCGAEMKTVYEILQAIPPAHLKFIQEHKDEAIVPFGGKYTWDALFNSVMYSPLWASFNFQLIDHIVYSRYGAIPSFAFTKVRRLTPTNPIPVSEGLLSRKCLVYKSDFTNGGYNNGWRDELLGYVDKYKDKLLPTSMKIKVKGETDEQKINREKRERQFVLNLITQKENRMERLEKNEYKFKELYDYYTKINNRITANQIFEVSAHLRNMYTDPRNSHQYYYYDLADHYALECVLVLDDSEDTIERIKSIRMNPFKKFKSGQFKYECWKDTMINEVVDSNDMFPRQWFDCSLEPIKNISKEGVDARIDRLPDDYNSIKSYLKGFFRVDRKDNRR